MFEKHFYFMFTINFTSHILKEIPMKKSLSLLWCLCLLFFGCDKDKEREAEMELNTAPILKFAGPSTSMIEFTSSSDWELQVENNKEIPDWLKLSQTNGGPGNNRIIVGVTRFPRELTGDNIIIKGSGNAQLSVRIFRAVGPEGDKKVSQIILYNEEENKTGEINFIYSIVSGDTTCPMFVYTMGSESRVTNSWQSEINRSVSKQEDSFPDLTRYIHFECMDSVYKYSLRIIRNAYEEEASMDLGTIEREKEYEYDKEGKLTRIVTFGSLSVKGFIWNDVALKMLQNGGDVFSFSHSSEWNNLNIDLFYFILYGLFDWDEDACLLQLTGLRPSHLPDKIEYKGATWHLNYERDQAGYITFIHITTPDGNRYKWQINYREYGD